MARPLKDGLDYFSLDTDIANDDKIKLIRAKHGIVGFAIVVLLLTKIYKNGYFYQWTEDEQYLFADEARVDINTVSTVVNDCINKGFFNQKLYEAYGILTSRGIQKRYLQGCMKRKKITVTREYFVADDYIIELKMVNVVINSVNSELMELLPEESTQSKVKEIESKVYAQQDAREGICKIVTDAFGFISSGFELDLINDWEATFCREWVLEAVRIAVLKKSRNLKFVDGILQSWLKKGFKPDEKPWEVEQNGQRQRHTAGNNRTGKAGAVPSKTDWDNEPDSF